MAGLMVSILDESKGADIYQIAKKSRTNVEMIEKFCVAHIKNNISAAAANVRKKPLTNKAQEELDRRNAHMSSRQAEQT